MIFNRILEDLGSDHVQAWHDIAGTAPERVGSGEGTASNQSRVLTAMKLLISFKDFDVYFRDRDGQCFMHYVAKDDGKVLEYMTNKGYNPLVRDRSGKTGILRSRKCLLILSSYTFSAHTLKFLKIFLVLSNYKRWRIRQIKFSFHLAGSFRTIVPAGQKLRFETHKKA